ncbi:MAG: tripartite tricarboxylate transporter substrate binding protein [Burkholderiales bacterium]
MLRFAKTVLFSYALLGSCAAAFAQDVPYPKRGNVEMTVLFPAGTSADVTARMLAQGMTKHLGANVVVVNRPGAAGAIGYRYVAAQKPDGYNIVWNSNSISTTYHSGQLAFDYKAFDPVARVLVESPVLVVRSDAPWKTLGDLMKDARSRPGKITVANSGAGSHTHITSVALFQKAGVNVLDVPYGAAQVIPNLLGGHVDAMVQLPGAVAGHVQSGTVRILATVTQKRDPLLPDAPTAQEQGVDVALEAWRGIAVPKGTPRAAIATLERAIRATAESAEFAQQSEKLSVKPAFLPAQEFGEAIAREDAQTARIMQTIGLKK